MKTQAMLERMHYQSEEDENKRKYEKEKRKIAEKMAPIKEGDHPEAYIYKFEEVMREVEFPQREWPHFFTTTTHWHSFICLCE